MFNQKIISSLTSYILGFNKFLAPSFPHTTYRPWGEEWVLSRVWSPSLHVELVFTALWRPWLHFPISEHCFALFFSLTGFYSSIKAHPASHSLCEAFLDPTHLNKSALLEPFVHHSPFHKHSSIQPADPLWALNIGSALSSRIISMSVLYLSSTLSFTK